jgi:hypothetical protein
VDGFLRTIDDVPNQTGGPKRPLGDIPTIIGTILGGLALVVSMVAYLFPRSADSGKPATSPAEQAARDSWFAQHTGLWIYLGFLGLLAMAYIAFRRTRRPIAALMVLVFGGIAFELMFWDLMNTAGQVVSVAALTFAPVATVSILVAKYNGPFSTPKEPPAAAPEPPKQRTGWGGTVDGPPVQPPRPWLNPDYIAGPGTVVNHGDGQVFTVVDLAPEVTQLPIQPPREARVPPRPNDDGPLEAAEFPRSSDGKPSPDAIRDSIRKGQEAAEKILAKDGAVRLPRSKPPASSDDRQRPPK